MAKKEKYLLNFCATGYGWAGMSPEGYNEKMQAVYDRYEELRAIHKFDAIAFTGSSGAAAAFPLAMLFKIPMIYVRKDGENSHGSPVECNARCHIKKYLIVDDFVSSGETVRRIVAKIRDRAEMKDAYIPRPVGVMCFDTSVNCTATVPVMWRLGAKAQPVRIPIFGTIKGDPDND
jgi:hypothetical protein